MHTARHAAAAPQRHAASARRHAPAPRPASRPRDGRSGLQRNVVVAAGAEVGKREGRGEHAKGLGACLGAFFLLAPAQSGGDKASGVKRASHAHTHTHTQAECGTKIVQRSSLPPPPLQSDDPRTAAVLTALATIPDPDLGIDIVAAGFVKGLTIDEGGAVSFTLELTTPACPVKEEFRSSATAAVSALPWATAVDVTMSSTPPPAPVDGDDNNGRPGGLARVRHVVAVSSCKGGVGKSTVAVNLAFTLAQMGARVGLLDADVYGPSLPTMATPVDPRDAVLGMDPDTRALTPVDVHGVVCVSFGWAGQGAAIMRGPMVSGLIGQLATTTEWGALDYLVVDFPPGTGDIQLTLCQVSEREEREWLEDWGCVC